MLASPRTTELHANRNEDQRSDSQSTESLLVQVSSQSAAATSRTSVGYFSFQMPLETCLVPWLDSFYCCTTQWGLVTDVRDDGTSYQRHGVVVEVSAEKSTAVEASFRKRHLPLQRLRQAIDLVKLALAGDPLAIKSLLMRRARTDYAVDEKEQDPYLSEDELDQVARGDVVFELRLRLEVRDDRTQGFRQGQIHLIKNLDEEEIDASDRLRRCLVERVLAAGATRRLLDLPVSTVLMVSTIAEGDRCGSFFTLKKWAMESVKKYQDDRATNWVMERHHAPLTIKSTEVRLRGAVGLDRITRTNARALVREGTRVFYTFINIDARSIQCDKKPIFSCFSTRSRGTPQVQAIQSASIPAIAAATDMSKKATARITVRRSRCCCDVSDESTNLSEFERCVLALPTKENRGAIIRGLVKFILPRGLRTSMLLDNIVQLNDTDAFEILSEGEQWCSDHPNDELSLRTLRISPDEGSALAVLALLHVLEDAEEISLSSLSDVFLSNHVEKVLRFPSLRSLTLENLMLRDMDLFISRAGDDPQLRLETLQLSGLTLVEPASVAQSIESLDPHGEAPSTLSQTDPTLPMNNDDDDDDDNFDGRPKIRLAVYDSDALAILDQVLASNTTLRYVNFLGDFTIRPVMRAYEKFPSPAKTSSMAVPPALLRGSNIAQARKMAFISALYGGSCASACRLDSNIISMVFEYSGSYIERRVRV